MNMKPDRYTKAILTVIALILIWSLIQVQTPATEAQLGGGTKFGHLQTFGLQGFFDARTGDIWLYDLSEGTGRVAGHVRLEELGKPLNMHPQ